MQYTGSGVRHKTTRDSTRQLEVEIQEATDVQEDEDTWAEHNPMHDDESDENEWETDDGSDSSESDSDSGEDGLSSGPSEEEEYNGFESACTCSKVVPTIVYVFVISPS